MTFAMRRGVIGINPCSLLTSDDRPRHGEHAEDDRPVQRELHLLLVGHSRHQLARLSCRPGGDGEDQRNYARDESWATHDRRPRVPDETRGPVWEDAYW